MATDNESFNRDLYDLLKVRGYQPVPLDSKNQRVPASQAADVIQFTFTKDGEEYGKAWVSIDDAQNVIVYYDEEQQESPSNTTPGVEYDDSWTGFLKHLKNWSQRRQLSFELANKDRLGDDMRQRDYYKMKEKLGEGYHPMGKKASYNDAVPSVKIILQHNRALEEGEQRYRNVAKIFLENQDGERFLAPTTRPGIARVYARHIAEGGVPNDEKWNHIKSICEDYNKMAGFVRATRNGQFNESAQELVTEGINHYNNLRETLHKLATHRGYQNYFESWTPTLMEDELDESINDLFVQEMVDPRIENAMPILSRLKKPVTEMEEIDSLAEWADGIINEKLELGESESLKLKNIKLEAPRFKMWDSNKGPIPFSATLEQNGKPTGQVEIMVDANASPDAWNQEDVNINSIKVTSNGKEIDPNNIDIPYIEIKTQLLDVIGDPYEWSQDNAPPSRDDYLYDLDEMDKEHGSKRDFDNARGPDKTAKMMKAKDAVKAARKTLDKAFNKAYKGDVEENFIGMAPQAVAEEELDEVLDTTDKVLDYINKSADSFKSGDDKTKKKRYAGAQKLAKKFKDQQVDEDLGPEQKRVGQLGPTEKVRNNNIGKLVGASESTEVDPELARIIEMAKFKS